MAAGKPGVMTDRQYRCATLAAGGEPALEYAQPVFVKIAAGFIKQHQRRSHRREAGNGDHPPLRGMQIQRMRVGNVF